MKLLVIVLMMTALGAVYSISSIYKYDSALNWKTMSVMDFMVEQGYEAPNYFIQAIDSSKARQGEDLVTIGYTRIDKINTKRISKHFVCINCHNTVPETNELSQKDPEVRFDYMMKNKLPFLPGSSLYGVVNRTSFFNGDYKKKYGSLADSAKHDLQSAIQLCADISSEGRQLEKWEVEAILHYLNSIQLNMSDLNLSVKEVEIIENGSKTEKLELVLSKFLSAEKASFGFPLAANVRTKGKNGDWKKGEYIFKYGCMHCHNPEGITTFTLEADQLNRNFLKNRMDKTNRKSIYEITRTGTQPKKLKKTYMPLYTYEKLTDKQLEDLAAYLNYKPN